MYKCIVEVSLSKLKRETVRGEKSYWQAVVLESEEKKKNRNKTKSPLFGCASQLHIAGDKQSLPHTHMYVDNARVGFMPVIPVDLNVPQMVRVPGSI